MKYIMVWKNLLWDLSEMRSDYNHSEVLYGLVRSYNLQMDYNMLEPYKNNTFLTPVRYFENLLWWLAIMDVFMTIVVITGAYNVL